MQHDEESVFRANSIVQLQYTIEGPFQWHLMDHEKNQPFSLIQGHPATYQIQGTINDMHFQETSIKALLSLPAGECALAELITALDNVFAQSGTMKRHLTGANDDTIACAAIYFRARCERRLEV